MKRLFFLFVLFFIMIVPLQVLSFPLDETNLGNNSIFIENEGQWDDEVLYLCKLDGLNAWITKTGVVYDHYKIEKAKAEPDLSSTQISRDNDLNNTNVYGHVIKMELVNSKDSPQRKGKSKQSTYCNYLIGNDKSKWAKNVSLYKSIEVNEIYEGIGIRYYIDEGLLRYDFRIKVGADISQLRFRVKGEEDLRINKSGELVIKTALGEVTHGKIYAYQGDAEVDCSFKLNEDGKIGLKVETYDAEKELIIDPLVYSSFIGGSGYERGHSADIDTEGNIYVTGETLSSNFPVTEGAYQNSMGGVRDVYITKLNSNGDSLIYATFLGGSGWDSGNSITLDDSGSAYITGSTESANFPVSDSAYQTSNGGNRDAFAVKLNADTTNLIYSTFIGGSNYERGSSIAIDNNGNALVTGSTASSNFPVLDGAFQTGHKGKRDVFITKLNSTGENLVYSTFIGGDQEDWGNALVLDNAGNAYVTGVTYSKSFPVSDGAYQENHADVSIKGDAFVLKLNSSGSDLSYSTYLGGNEGHDEGRSITLDNEGNAYLSGYTGSTSFPTTEEAYQTSFGGGYYDVFVTKLNPSGSELVYSTYLGGDNGHDDGTSIKLDNQGNALIAGYTGSSNFPIVEGSFQMNFGGGYYDAFLTKINSNGTDLIYSTFIGGKKSDSGNSIVLVNQWNALVIGTTESTDFPANADSNYIPNNTDAFVSKVNMILTSAENIDPPNNFALEQNYPNPFNPATTIKFSLPGKSRVKLTIYNSVGQKVKTLVNSELSAGEHSVKFKAGDLASGVYFYQLNTNDFVDTKKMVLLR